MMNTNPSAPARERAKTACGGIINSTNAWPSATYQGKKVYLCLQACLRVFRQYPDDFMAGGIEHPLEED
jgi:YHS domain-containing protein